ncbi:MAG: hypothetical protein KatS3mg124_1685 [Porticoccaceae bacterium]|nr:MAG: hypothetical protein KatS3mg124_1685 [Porticoccaceae bacterium]
MRTGSRRKENDRERRGEFPPIPGDLSSFLSPAQARALRDCEARGWRLVAVRRAGFRPAELLLRRADGAHGLVAEDGALALCPPETVRGGRGKAGGFTLLELLVVLLLMGVLAALGVPRLEELLARRRVEGVAEDYVKGLVLARSEAVRRAAEVRFRPRDGADWASGFAVVADRDRDGDYDDEPLLVGGDLPPGVAVAAAADHALTNPWLAFDALGAVTPLGERLSLRVQVEGCRPPVAWGVAAAGVGAIGREAVPCAG